MWRWARVRRAASSLLLNAGTTSINRRGARWRHFAGQGPDCGGRIYERPYAGGPKGDEPFIDGSDYRIKLAISDVLIGNARARSLSDADHHRCAAGRCASRNLPAGEQGADGQFEPLAWDYVADGICVDTAPHGQRLTGLRKSLPALEQK